MPLEPVLSPQPGSRRPTKQPVGSHQTYRLGYGAVAVLSMVFIYFVMPEKDQNPGYIFGYIWGGTVVMLCIPALFA